MHLIASLNLHLHLNLMHLGAIAYAALSGLCLAGVFSEHAKHAKGDSSTWVS